MEVNKRIGDYEILGELGRGGMGRVYRVRNVIADRVEAMKVLLPDLAGRQDVAARFLREIKVLAALDHPNIAALRTALTADNQLVMIMEYVEGQSIAERLTRGPIDVPDALSYIDQVLDALDYAHRRGVVHRDIKPGNMMLTPAGVVKLTDFGIARSARDETITVAGTTTGSLSYMAPEQVSGQTTDARSDLYSVGISLYEMVTGQRPFRADNDFRVMIAHLQQEPRPPIELQPSLPPSLNSIILQAIAKGPDARFQTAQEFRRTLRSVSSGATHPVRSDDPTVLLPASVPTVTAQSPAAAPFPVGSDQLPPSGGQFHGAGSQVPGTSSQRPAASSQPPIAASESPAASPHVPISDPRSAVAGNQPPAASFQSPAPSPQSPAPNPQPSVAMRSGHPLLFVALGAVLVITALVGTGLYLGRAAAEPGRSSGTAPAASAAPSETIAPSADVNTPDTTTDPDAVSPPVASSTEPSAAAGGTASLPGPSASTPVPAGQPSPPPSRVERGPAQTTRTPAAASTPASSSTRGAEPSQPGAASAAPVQADTAELDEIEGELDQLTTRAAAITSGLDRLQQQQARQGLGLRGDMLARQESMRINLSRAQEALAKRDAARARKHRDTARADIETLERFLGR